jgi:hypothetical protein
MTSYVKGQPVKIENYECYFKQFAKAYQLTHGDTEIVNRVHSNHSLWEIREWLYDHLNTKHAATDETRRTYLNALKQLIKHDQCKNIDPTIRDAFVNRVTDEHHILSKRVKETESKNQLDPKEDKHWMSWDIIQQLLTSLETICDYDLSKSYDYKLWQQRLLLSMYVYQPAPLRQDYNNVILQWDADTNCIHEGQFYLRRDKVSNSQGDTVIPLHPNIIRLLNTMEQKFPGRRYLITDLVDRAQPIDKPDKKKSRISALLDTIPRIDDPTEPSHLGVITIRSAYASAFLSDASHTENDILSVAKQMRTSKDMMRTYYRKIVTPPITNVSRLSQSPTLVVEFQESTTLE